MRAQAAFGRGAPGHREVQRRSSKRRQRLRLFRPVSGSSPEPPIDSVERIGCGTHHQSAGVERRLAVGV